MVCGITRGYRVRETERGPFTATPTCEDSLLDTDMLQKPELEGLVHLVSSFCGPETFLAAT
jgi:hypothetical protein